MLGVCTRLGKRLDIDPIIFQILFIFWGLSSFGTALLVYIILYFLL
jgi:phage shock protein PspC (stress-responsive transcriptional regulator)